MSEIQALEKYSTLDSGRNSAIAELIRLDYWTHYIYPVSDHYMHTLERAAVELDKRDAVLVAARRLDRAARPQEGADAILELRDALRAYDEKESEAK